jgi:hypothetical protein
MTKQQAHLETVAYTVLNSCKIAIILNVCADSRYTLLLALFVPINSIKVKMGLIG